MLQALDRIGAALITWISIPLVFLATICGMVVTLVLPFAVGVFYAVFRLCTYAYQKCVLGLLVFLIFVYVEYL